MAADVHALTFGRVAGVLSGVVNVIAANSKGVAIPAIHRECIVLGLEDFAVLERHVVAANKSDS